MTFGILYMKSRLNSFWRKTSEVTKTKIILQTKLQIKSDLGTTAGIGVEGCRDSCRLQQLVSSFLCLDLIMKFELPLLIQPLVFLFPPWLYIVMGNITRVIKFSIFQHFWLLLMKKEFICLFLRMKYIPNKSHVIQKLA